MYPLLFIKLMLMTSLAGWLSIACFNNIVDRATNRHLLQKMLCMDLLRDDNELLGQGLLMRAWQNKQRVHTLLWIIVGIQAFISIFLWSSAILFIEAIFANHYFSLALELANWSLLGFMMLWLGFLCGGLWFGYWIKMSQVQTTHLLLLVISLLTMIIINIPLGWSVQ